MVKENKQPDPQYSSELNEEIKDLMGPPPEEAEPKAAEPEIANNTPEPEPTGPPPVIKEGKIYLRETPTTSEAKAAAIKPIKVESDDKGLSDRDIGAEVKGTPLVDVPEIESDTSDNDTKKPNISEVADEVNQQLLAQQGLDTPSSKKPIKIVDNTASPNDTIDPEDEVLDKAVTDIIAKESDELLAVVDVIRNGDTQKPIVKKPKKNIFVAWWQNKKLRYFTIALIATLLFGAAMFPSSRYAVLNAAGVRAGLSVQVIDTKYGLPIKNVEVMAGGQKATTDVEGRAKLKDVRLGKTQLVFAKRSFAPKSQEIIVGWGSNPFNDPIQLEATGSAYNFIVTDWISKLPVAKAEISDGESKVLTDEKGKVSMLVQSNDKDIKFTVKANDYRTEQVIFSVTDKDEKAVQLVPSSPDIFVSKRSGKYDVYRKDVDGSNETVLLGGTGAEQDNIALLPNQTASVAAVVSTRDGKRDKDGYLLSNLYIVEVGTKTVVKVPDTEAAQIQLIDWAGDKLIFVKVSAGVSAAAVGRQKIISYDYKQEKATELASANYYNDVEVFKNQVYFAPNSTGTTAQLYRVNPDNSSKTVLLSQEVWQILRVKNNKIQANAADKKWYEQSIGDAKMTVLSSEPANPANKIYVDSPDGEKSVWVDERDGKGVLVLEDVKTSESKILFSRGGLGYPIRWLSGKHVLVRISNSQETGDYVLNIEGGDLVKVGDVTNTASTNRWYYYR